MLKELIKLSSYLNGSKYSAELNKLIKTASDIENDLSVLNDYLIEIGREKDTLKLPKRTKVYSISREFLSNLKRIYDTHNNDLLKTLCKNVFNSINDIDLLCAGFLYNYISRSQLNVLKDVLKHLIDYFINNDLIDPTLSEYQRNEMIRLLNSIVSANSIEEINDIRIDLFDSGFISRYYATQDNFSFWEIFNKLILETHKFNHYEFVSWLVEAENDFGVDLLAILKNRITLDNI